MSTSEPREHPTSTRPPWVSIAAGAAIVVVVVVLFLVLRGGDDDGPVSAGPTGPTAVTAPQAAKPVAATPVAIAKLGKDLKRTIYWVGASEGRTYELSNYTDGRIFIRYLERGVKVGDSRPDFLTVGTYAQKDPFKTVSDVSKQPGAQVEKLANGGLGVANKAQPTSWYVAYPDGKELIEVYSPKAGRARELVRTKRVVPVEG